ncbi:type VI secretion system protein TssA [Bordetella sp. N]|uniref:type VI secretion system protein TssA n=1 Tax=Bordetella sp. N TaxID=1746199 RepID=UPI0012E38B39|nr:type VI secretion system protein TssA [Bordetella sp. N]
MEFADILTALDPRLPCGEDLEYDADFLLLQQAAVGKAEQQFGSTIIPADPPEWREVEKRAHALLERTRDLRIISYLTRAWTEIRGLPGYAEGLTLAADALERYWDSVHPRLQGEDEDADDADPMPRVYALTSLGDVQGCARSARSASLLTGVHGQLSLRDAEAVLDGTRTDTDAYPGGRERLIQNLRIAAAQGSTEVAAVNTAAVALARIQALVSTRLGAEWAPDYRGVLRTLQCVAQQVQDSGSPDVTDASQTSVAAEGAAQASTGTVNASGAAVAAAAAAGAATSSTPAPAAVMRWQDAQIRSRDDAMLMLAKVCAYFETHEPSHPAPYLIQRTQQLISMRFHDIMRNLAPQGLEQFEAWLPKDADGRALN